MPDAATINAFNRNIVDEFRGNGGKVTGQFANANLLLLTTTGAKSGQQRVSPLAYFDIDGKLIIIGSFAGAPNNPAWVHNLRADPRAHVEVGTDAFDVTARELPTAERDELFAEGHRRVARLRRVSIENQPDHPAFRAATRVVPL